MWLWAELGSLGGVSLSGVLKVNSILYVQKHSILGGQTIGTDIYSMTSHNRHCVMFAHLIP